MIRAILFDLDRTLLDRDKSFDDFVRSQYERFSHVLSGVPREIFVARVIALDGRGTVGKDEVYHTVIEEFGMGEISRQDLVDDFEFRMADHYVPFPGLRETLNILKSSGYLLGIVSNGRHEFQMRSIRTLEIEQDFDVILISESEGIRKPEAGIFKRALHRLGCEPHESIFVGDNPAVDIMGAHRIGMKTIWKRNKGDLPPLQADAVLDDLEELPALVKALD